MLDTRWARCFARVIQRSVYGMIAASGELDPSALRGGLNRGDSNAGNERTRDSGMALSACEY